jgi:ATP-dependent helicase/nuclease subunit A
MNKISSFPEVRVVEASAGSGKTYALAKRYVQLLLNPDLAKGLIPLRNILAITFTNKAAFEMKARILELLKKIALNEVTPREEENILKPLQLNRREAQQKAFGIMEELIHHYNFFQVQTIDSFINALLCGCAFKIGLSAKFHIQKNYPEYLQYSLDEVIEETAHDPYVRKLFETFLHQYLFLENRSGWFPKQDILDLLKALYEQRNIYGIDFVKQERSTAQLGEKKKHIRSLLERLHEQLPEGVHKGFVTSFENFLGRNRGVFNVDSLPEYFSRTELPVTKGATTPAKTARLWETVQKEIRELCETEAATLFSPYIAMFQEALSRFQRRTVKDDVLFLGELNRKARHLFDEGGITVEELYYRLATRFHHYLFDEFQDTSRLQWRNLSLMVEEALSTGGTLFYVGDKKQAIFNFRGGEVKLFEALQKEYQAFNVQREALSCNYRSEKSIVEFNNQVFAVENLNRFLNLAGKDEDETETFSDEERTELANVFSTAQQSYLPGKEGGYVQIEVVEGKNKEEREELIRPKLIVLIRELRQRYSYRDMTILTRSNDEIELLTAWLMAEDIFVESERTLNIKESPLIEELVAFLQFLDSPGNNLAFARFVTGEIFCKAVGIPAKEMHHFLFRFRERLAQERDFYLYKEFRTHYESAWGERVDEFFLRVGLYPLYEFMVSIIERFEVLRNFPGQQGFVMHFLELIKKQEEEHTDIGSFLEAFEEMEHEDVYVNVTDSDSIKIMTIHKAKGLEFPVVIIPFLDMRVRIGTSGGLGQQSYVLDFQEEGLQLLRIKKKYLKYSETLSEIYRREYFRALMSELNNTYVAFTRAARELVAFIPQKNGGQNLASALIPEEIRRLGLQDYKGTALATRQSPNRLGPSVYQDWINFLRDEFVGIASVSHREKIFQGEVLHSLLAQIGNLQEEDRKKSIAKALEQTKAQYPHVANFSEYEKHLRNILKNKSLGRFFAVDDGQVFQEQDVVNDRGQTRRLDRLIVKKNEVWVIDYKSTHEAAADSQEQVRDYLKIMAGLEPGKKVSGFIIYLDDLKVEEVSL